MSKLANLNINFLGKTKYTFVISTILVLASIFFLSTKWLNLGLDFTGGMTIELKSEKSVDTDIVRKVLFNNKLYKSAQVLFYGSEKNIQIKLPPSEGSTTLDTKNLLILLNKNLKDKGYNFKFLSQSDLGPQFGQELINKGTLSLLLALAGIMIYISIRFQWKLSVGAVVALIHDLTITLGFFSFTQIEFNLTVLAALLAVLGYSVNDTVVVFDRIRENFRIFHSEKEIVIANKSINQTMSRTLITSLTTLLSVTALAIFGGPILFGFAIALIVGILIGTYSSIFVASALALKLGLKKEDLIPKKIEDIDDMP